MYGYSCGFAAVFIKRDGVTVNAPSIGGVTVHALDQIEWLGTVTPSTTVLVTVTPALFRGELDFAATAADRKDAVYEKLLSKLHELGTVPDLSQGLLP
jgi:hypothetical protein